MHVCKTKYEGMLSVAELPTIYFICENNVWYIQLNNMQSSVTLIVFFQ